jgi:anaphase-promoting complex subunit 4
MIMNTLNYIEDTIEHINEAWESVLLEMDNKLAKYAKKQQPGAVSADFLELLMFGYPSEALEIFLTQEMTVRELKKLSNSVDMSYSTIQKLVVKPLHSAIVSLFYHINDVYGMHQNSYFYKGLLGEVTNDPLMKTGSFLIKSHELQQTIDKSMRDYKIFFRWLYITVSRLIEDMTPDDASALNQQEINYLAEFLYNFEEYRKDTVGDSGEKEIKFNLERVGQYLSPNDLLIPPQNDTNNLWDTILADNECIRASKLIYPHNKKSSLMSEKNAMRKSVDDLFERIETSIGSGFKLHSGRHLKSDVEENEFKIVTSHFHDSKDIDKDIYINTTMSTTCDMFTILSLENDLLFVACYPDCEIKIAKMHFADNNDLNLSNIGQLSFIDVKFYSSKFISVFMKNEVGNKSHSCFFQLSVPRLLDHLNDHHHSEILSLNLFNFIDDGSFKSIDGFNGSMMAVSGSRKVASFLASNQKIVKLYELEVDEDDPDEMDASNNASIEIN